MVATSRHTTSLSGQVGHPFSRKFLGVLVLDASFYLGCMCPLECKWIRPWGCILIFTCNKCREWLMNLVLLRLAPGRFHFGLFGLFCVLRWAWCSITNHVCYIFICTLSWPRRILKLPPWLRELNQKVGLLSNSIRYWQTHFKFYWIFLEFVANPILMGNT